MRTVCKDVYQFDELNEQAQQKAVDNYRQTAEYFWSDDAINSLKEFAKHFGCELGRYEIDFYQTSYSSASFSVPDTEYTENELSKLIESMGSYNKETLKGNGDCKFTGFGMDEDAADGARMAFHEGQRDLLRILEAGFRSWLEACEEDYEQQVSAEGFAEFAESNELEFYEDGSRF